MFEFERTDIASVANEIAPLIRAGLAGRYPNLPREELLPNLDVYCEAEDSELLYLFAAREDSKLIGCLIVFLSAKLHRAEHLLGVVDALYVLPENRGNGVAGKLLAFAENQLREAGVKTLVAASDDPRIIRWLRMTSGYSYTETVLEKGL